ncbi:MAG: hypothetical protein VR72_11290 [Clostridiaceae bacterium BRH_c20a]|nr:MAG: hypothetical protein VR72_11290 [Clostridiaceae bacterium BRH_c20a]
MGKWLKTQFGQYTLASTLVLLSFPFLYLAGTRGQVGLLIVAFILLGLGMVYPLIGLLYKINK